MAETTTESLSASSGEHRMPGRFLVLALEARRPLAPPRRLVLSPELRDVSIGRGPDRCIRRADDCLAILVPDRTMSTRHATLSWARTHWTVRDAGSKNGTRVNGVRIDCVGLRDGDRIEVGTTTFVYRECLLEHRDWRELQAAEAERPEPGALTTLAPELEAQLSTLRRVAAGDAPVMLSGESGTGKELVARAIHDASGRSGDFVAVNCGALPATLLESELFGHRKGSFSGATEDRPGLIRAADGGTLFLDEIAELPESAQVALLRVLQEQCVRAIGATSTVPVDIRVVTATHQDVQALVERGDFRADLYARLAGFSLTLCPLRERREDLGLLVATLLRRLAGDRAEALRLRGEAAWALFAHEWPLNVRELEQALRVALSVAEGDEIALRDLPESVRPRKRTARERDERHRALVDALRLHRGNISGVARDLSTSRAQVRRLLERYEIDLDPFRRGGRTGDP